MQSNTACAVEYCLVQSNTAVCSRILPCAVKFESFAHQHSSDSSCHVDSKVTHPGLCGNILRKKSRGHLQSRKNCHIKYKLLKFNLLYPFSIFLCFLYIQTISLCVSYEYYLKYSSRKKNILNFF